MNKLNKVALSVAIAAAPFMAQSLEALDDDFLSEITGQEGISIDRTYKNTIEEFKYIDGDGDGSGVAGEVSVSDIRIGNFASPSDTVLGAINDSNSAGANLSMINEVGAKIDATANGVLLTNGNVGTEARVIVNEDLSVIGAFNPTYAHTGGSFHSIVDDAGDFTDPANWLDLGAGGAQPSGGIITDQHGVIHVNANTNGAVTAATGGAVPTGVAVYKTLEATMNLQSQASASSAAVSAGFPAGQLSNSAAVSGFLAGLPAAQRNALDPDGDGAFGYDEAADSLVDNAEVLRSYGDGKDTYIGAINIGNENGEQNSIGSVMMLNQSNYVGSARVLRLVQRWGINTSNAYAMLNNNANTWARGNVLISSKTSGTGVHIVQESSNGAQVAVYTDTHDDAGNVVTSGNQIGVVGLSTFRLADVDSYDNAGNEDGNAMNGTYLRGARSEFDIDVEDGKLVLSNQVKDQSMILNNIFIGDLEGARDSVNPTGIIGGIAILGQHTEGTTKIYAH